MLIPPLKVGTAPGINKNFGGMMKGRETTKFKNEVDELMNYE